MILTHHRPLLLFVLALICAGDFQSMHYDIKCIETSCPAELSECSKDAPLLALEVASYIPDDEETKTTKESNGKFLETHRHTDCSTALQCILHAEGESLSADKKASSNGAGGNPQVKPGQNDVSVCTDGIENKFGAIERKFHDCANRNKCIQKHMVKDTESQSFAEHHLIIKRVNPECMRNNCARQFIECGKDVECKAVAECLETNLDSPDSSACTKHVSRLDPSEGSLMHCARQFKCVEEGNPKAFVEVVGETSFLQTSSHASPSSLLQVSDKSNAKTSVKSRFSEMFRLESQSPAVKKAEAAWEQSRKNTDALLAKVHQQMQKLNEDLDNTAKQQKHDLALLEENRIKENEQLEETEKKLQAMAKQSIKLPESDPTSSFLEKTSKDDAIFAPLRQAAAAAKKFAEDIKRQAQQFQSMKNLSPTSFLAAIRKMDNLGPVDTPKASLLETNVKNGGIHFGSLVNENSEKADRSLSLAQQALSKLNKDLASQRKTLMEQEAKLKKEEDEAKANFKHQKIIGTDGKPLFSFAEFPILQDAASFVQVDSKSHHNLELTDLPGFGGPSDPLSPEALTAWRDKFEAKLRKAREIARAGLPASAFAGESSLLQENDGLSSWNPSSYQEAQENIRKGQRDVQRMQQQFDEGLEKLKAENARLLAESKAQLEKDRELKDNLEAERAKREAMQSSLLQKGEVMGFDPQKEEEHIRALERKWKREAAKIAQSGDAKLNQMDAEQNSLIEQAKEKEEEQRMQLEKIRSKLDKDLEKLHKDVAEAQTRAKKREEESSSFIQEAQGEKKSVSATSFVQVASRRTVPVVPVKSEDQPKRSTSQPDMPAEKSPNAVEDKSKESASDEKVAGSTSVAAEKGDKPVPAFIQEGGDSEAEADTALEKAEESLKKLERKLQSRSPKAVISDGKSQMEKLMQSTMDAPFPIFSLDSDLRPSSSDYGTSFGEIA